MTQEEYYRLLEEKAKATNWNDLQAVREYNEYARRLRNRMEYEEE